MNRRVIFIFEDETFVLRSEEGINTCLGLGDFNRQCPFHRVIFVKWYDPATQKEGAGIYSACLRKDCDVWQNLARFSFVINHDEGIVF